MHPNEMVTSKSHRVTLIFSTKTQVLQCPHRLSFFVNKQLTNLKIGVMLQYSMSKAKHKVCPKEED